MNAFRKSAGVPVLLGACSLALLGCLQAQASDVRRENMGAPPGDLKATYRVSADGKSINVLPALADARPLPSATCLLTVAPTRARLSFDGLSLLVTSNGFVPVPALQACGKTPIPVRMVAAQAGMLEDVNTAQGLYLGLLPVSTQPMAYLAVVGKLGSTRNRVSLPGAYIESKNDTQHQQEAFSYADETGPYAKISRDGRFAAPNGELDCSRDAYPGVWTLATNQKLVLDGSPESIQASCAALFEAAPRR